jgi:hypothetical protein
VLKARAATQTALDVMDFESRARESKLIGVVQDGGWLGSSSCDILIGRR